MSTHHRKRRAAAKSSAEFDRELEMLTGGHIHPYHLSPNASRKVFAPITDSSLRIEANLQEEVQKQADEVLQHADKLSSFVQWKSLDTFLKNNEEKRYRSKENEIKYTFIKLAADIFHSKHPPSSFWFAIKDKIEMSEEKIKEGTHKFLRQFLSICEQLELFVRNQSQIVNLVEIAKEHRSESFKKEVEYMFYLGILDIREKLSKPRMEKLIDEFQPKIMDISRVVGSVANNDEQLSDMVSYYEARATSSAADAIKFAVYSLARDMLRYSPSYEP
jgi:hypothetical protein